MSKNPCFALVIVLIVAVTLAGCSGGGGQFGSDPGSDDAPVVLAMTDAPPANVSILAGRVTVTGATLNPGNVPLLSGPSAPLELTRLQTDVTYLGTTPVSAGSYTSLTLTFTAPFLTFQNDTGAPVVAGVGNPTPMCTNGAICTIQSVASNLTATIPVTMTVSGGSATGLLVDLNLSSVLLPSLGVDFQGGVTATQFTPAVTGVLPAGAEDVIGRITAINTAPNSFTFQDATRSYSLLVNSDSLFLEFPTSVCATQGFACLRIGQIVSVDIGLGTDGVPLARNVLFEHPDATSEEVEGIVTGVNLGLQTFNIVTLAQSATVSGLGLGDPATVNYTVATSFDKDVLHADGTVIDTIDLPFGMPADLLVGQQVLVRRAATSSGTVINAERVRLRSSRITASVQMPAPPNFNLGGGTLDLPSFLTAQGINPIQVRTDPNATIFAGNALNIGNILLNDIVSARGMLFSGSGSPVLVAAKVVEH